MAAQRVGRRGNRACGPQSPGQNQQRRQARVTVKYNRKELQRRLDVEKWVDCGLDELFRGRVSHGEGGDRRISCSPLDERHCCLATRFTTYTG